MISNSVSNKNWIFKKYNEQDVIFYKENYSLDELTSKLLSIRKIKKESFINLYIVVHNKLMIKKFFIKKCNQL